MDQSMKRLLYIPWPSHDPCNFTQQLREYSIVLTPALYGCNIAEQIFPLSFLFAIFWNQKCYDSPYLCLVNFLKIPLLKNLKTHKRYTTYKK